MNVKPAPVVVSTPLRRTAAEGDDRKLLTLRFTFDQRHYLKQVALDEQTTVQEWIVDAIEAKLAAKRLDSIESKKL